MKTSFKVIDGFCADYSLVEKIFKQIIEPVFGLQENVLHKIKRGNSVLCEGLFVDETLKGFVAYKKQLNEIRNRKSLEVIAFTLAERSEETAGQFNSLLFNRLEAVARQRKADYIFFTLSEKQTNLIKFFNSQDVTMYDKKDNPLKQGEKLQMLSYKLPEMHPLLDTQNRGDVKLSKRKRDANFLLDSSSSSSSNYSISKTSNPPEDNVEFKALPFKRRTLPQDHADRFHSNQHSSDYQYGLDRYHSDHYNRRDEISNRRPSEKSSITGERYSSRFSFHKTQQDKPRQQTHTMHTCTLKNQYISAIADGRKSFEGRVNTSMFRNYQVGDTVKWFAGSCSVVTKIEERKEYFTFGEMLTDIGYRLMVPEASSLEHAVQLYERIPGYYEKSKRFGIVAFKLKVISPKDVQEKDNKYSKNSFKA